MITAGLGWSHIIPVFLNLMYLMVINFEFMHFCIRVLLHKIRIFIKLVIRTSFSMFNVQFPNLKFWHKRKEEFKSIACILFSFIIFVTWMFYRSIWDKIIDILYLYKGMYLAISKRAQLQLMHGICDFLNVLQNKS